MYSEIAWSFETAELRVELELVTTGEPYDGDDADGEFQRRLDDGELTQFDSVVRVIHRASEIELASDTLSGSVYEDPSQFWKAHRARNPLTRNCEAFRAARGGNARICHYFPGMVREACQRARERLVELGSIPVRAVRS